MKSHAYMGSRVITRVLNFLFVLLLACPLFAAAQGYVVISEILADNSNRADANEINEFGNTSDWVELYNPSGDTVNLNGWMLIKGAVTNTVRYIFTNDVWMPPDFYLRLWCDKDNTNSAGISQYHTGFSLDKNGDTLILTWPDGSTESSHITFGLQLADLSIGLDPTYYYYWQLSTPTPAPADRPSPWVPNSPYTQLGTGYDLRINEWCPTNWDWWINILNHPSDTNANNCGHCHDDWVELYNNSTNPVALAWMDTDYGSQMSLYLSTNFANTAVSSAPFVPYSYIPAKGYQRFWAVGKGKKSYDADELNVKFSNSSGDTITLTDADQITCIHTVTFPGQGAIPWVTTNGTPGLRTNVTWNVQGLLPDGETNNIVLFPIICTNNNVTLNKSTPGDSNFLPLTNGVYINEILAHTDPPLQDAVEFINTSTNDADISNFYFTNDKNNIKKYRIPSNPPTIVPAGGFKVLYEYQFNPGFIDINPAFTLNSAKGDSACLYSALPNGTLTGYRRVQDFDSSANSVSFGRYTNSAGNVDFVAMSQLTFGTNITSASPTNFASSNAFVHGLGGTNAYPLVGPVVISEIMYHPRDNIVNGTNYDNSLDEYVEIYNMSPNQVDLYLNDPTALNAYTNRWKIHQTVDYEFPQDAALTPALKMPPGGFFLFLNFAPWASTNYEQLTHFRQLYHIPDTFTNMYGPYKGKLGNSGGTIELYRPDYRQIRGSYSNYVPQILVEKVEYNDKAPWPTNADGNGYALQRLFPQGYVNDPTNWVADAPSAGTHVARFTSVSRSNNTVTLNFHGWPNVPYKIERTSTLVGSASTNATWSTFTNVPPQNVFGIRQVTDVVPPTERRFYRINSTAQQ